MFGIVVGVLASYLYKRDEIIDNLVKVDTNDGWHWTIWKKTIIEIAKPIPPKILIYVSPFLLKNFLSSLSFKN
mgnify:CR=1 FL=1